MSIGDLDAISFEGPVGLNEADLLQAGPEDGFAHTLLLVHELQGAVDEERLAAAVRWLGERHEGFRTSFVRTDAGWRRRVHTRVDAELERIDVSSEPDPEAAARMKVLAFGHTPFDRAVPPLIRPKLVKLAASRYWWVSYGDHVVLDGTAFTLALAELIAAYVQMGAGAVPSLPPATQPREHFAALEAVLGRLREAPGPHAVPDPPDGFPLLPDPDRPGGLDPAGARHVMALGDPDAIDRFARTRGVSRSAPIVAAMALALRALSARDDLAFSLIRSGRRDPNAGGVIGCLAWGDSFAVRIADDEPLEAVIARADGFLQDGALWRMLYIPTVKPASSRLVLNINRYDTALALPGLVAFPRPDIATDIRMWQAHDMLVQIFPMPGALHGVVRYRASMFEPATIGRFADRMRGALDAFLENPTAPVRSLA